MPQSEKEITLPVYSPSFWKAYLVQMRPYLLFVSGIAGAAGMAMSWNYKIPMLKWLIAFIPFFLCYGFGQALTDCFQTDTDKLSAPYRPLSRGIVSGRSVFTVSIAGLMFCAAILFGSNMVSFILSGLAVVGLASYSYIKRNSWFVGPFYNAWIVALLPVMGYFSLESSQSGSFPESNLSFLSVTFFSYASFVLIGYLKDIDADRATGYKTFPVVWGWDKTVLVGDVFALCTISFFWFNVTGKPFEVLAGGAGTLLIFFGQWTAHNSKNKNEKDALLPILSTVRSFICFHIAILLHFQPSWWPGAMGYYCLFELLLAKRPSQFQV